jgi:hypothetical protein
LRSCLTKLIAVSAQDLGHAFPIILCELFLVLPQVMCIFELFGGGLIILETLRFTACSFVLSVRKQ